MTCTLPTKRKIDVVTDADAPKAPMFYNPKAIKKGTQLFAPQDGYLEKLKTSGKTHKPLKQIRKMLARRRKRIRTHVKGQARRAWLGSRTAYLANNFVRVPYQDNNLVFV